MSALLILIAGHVSSGLVEVERLKETHRISFIGRTRPRLIILLSFCSLTKAADTAPPLTFKASITSLIDCYASTFQTLIALTTKIKISNKNRTDRSTAIYLFF